MKFSLKIEAVGLLEILGEECTSVFETEISEDKFREFLGKALYSVESQGYPFTTSEVYDDAICGYEGISLRRQYQKIYSSDVVKVSLKIA